NWVPTSPLRRLGPEHRIRGLMLSRFLFILLAMFVAKAKAHEGHPLHAPAANTSSQVTSRTDSHQYRQLFTDALRVLSL
ncbi:MAG: hypothetical protein AAGG44_15035, partial [Planctomycetota bacterium]